MTGEQMQFEETLERVYQKSRDGDENIIAILQSIQAEFGYLDREAIYWFSEKTGMSASRFYGVATFYSQFHLEPRGENIITVCSGTVCHVKGADRIISNMKQELGLLEDGHTTEDMKFTVENVNCVGACSIAPVVLINDKVFGKQTAVTMVKNIKPYRK